MSSIVVPEFSQATTGSGSSGGAIDVTSTAGYKVLAEAWLRGPSGSPASQKVKILKVVSSTQVKVCFIPEGITDPKLTAGTVKYPSYQGSDCSTYPINSTLSQPEQVVAIPSVG